MVFLYLVLYIFSLILGIGLVVNTPFNALIDSQPVIFLPSELLGGIVLIVLSFFFIIKAFKLLDQRLDEAKKDFLEEHNLVPDNSVTLRHEKHYVDVPQRLISVILPGKLEYYTDICTIEVIEDTWEAYIFDIPDNYTVVLHHKRSKEWETYSQA
mgnify:CR=1 FL=1